jgi:hypothetical protein
VSQKWRINFGIDTLKLGDVVDELLVRSTLSTARSPSYDSCLKHAAGLTVATGTLGRPQREVLSLVEGRDRAGRPVLVLAARRNSPPAFQVLTLSTEKASHSHRVCVSFWKRPSHGG